MFFVKKDWRDKDSYNISRDGQDLRKKNGHYVRKPTVHDALSYIRSLKAEEGEDLEIGDVIVYASPSEKEYKADIPKPKPFPESYSRPLHRSLFERANKDNALFDKLQKYQEGSLEHSQVVELFSFLVKNKLLSHLDKAYHDKALQLMQEGYLSQSGDILGKKRVSLREEEQQQKGEVKVDTNRLVAEVKSLLQRQGVDVNTIDEEKIKPLVSSLETLITSKGYLKEQ